ncbi:MAG: hypothetical protein RR788_04115 [Erysipelotrichaceae bacterium]
MTNTEKEIKDLNFDIYDFMEYEDFSKIEEEERVIGESENE